MSKMSGLMIFLGLCLFFMASSSHAAIVRVGAVTCNGLESDRYFFGHDYYRLGTAALETQGQSIQATILGSRIGFDDSVRTNCELLSTVSGRFVDVAFAELEYLDSDKVFLESFAVGTRIYNLFPDHED